MCSKRCSMSGSAAGASLGARPDDWAVSTRSSDSSPAEAAGASHELSLQESAAAVLLPGLRGGRSPERRLPTPKILRGPWDLVTRVVNKEL